MRSAYLLSTALLGPLLASPLLAVPPAASTAPPPLPAEHLTVEKLPARSPHWVYVIDESFANEIDSRVHVYDGDTYRHLGQIDGGFYMTVNISPDGATTAVGSTYFARGGHGMRTDVIEFVDNSALEVKHEILLPPKRAMTAPSLFNVAYSADQHFLYSANITPAASFEVLDPALGKVIGEIDTAGCVLVVPSGPNRVSSLCESGRLLTVTLDAQGKEASRGMSEPFFDPDKDPIFVQGIPTARGYAFVSFLGEVHEIDLTGPAPAFAKSWSLVTTEEKGRWRPGGMQPGAIHRDLGRLYVPMHVGGEGSHKDGGTEIWVFDTATHQRIARWSVAKHGLEPALAVQVSQDAAPLVFAATRDAHLAVFDGRSGQLKHVEKQMGQTPWMILNP
jgi:methylamine dehydrogenase heavy chain